MKPTFSKLAKKDFYQFSYIKNHYHADLVDVMGDKSGKTGPIDLEKAKDDHFANSFIRLTGDDVVNNNNWGSLVISAGKMKSLDNNTLTLEYPQGGSREFNILNNTKFKDGKKTISQHNIKPDNIVTVSWVAKGNNFGNRKNIDALCIRIGGLTYRLGSPNGLFNGRLSLVYHECSSSK